MDNSQDLIHVAGDKMIHQSIRCGNQEINNANSDLHDPDPTVKAAYGLTSSIDIVHAPAPTQLPSEIIVANGRR